MKILPEPRVRLHIPQLARLASVGHSDIALVRDVMNTKIDRRWLVENIDGYIVPILKAARDEEEYRRIAELYQELDADLLRRHLARCAAHASDEVREIASRLCVADR
jgi:hypothetical protein